MRTEGDGGNKGKEECTEMVVLDPAGETKTPCLGGGQGCARARARRIERGLGGSILEWEERRGEGRIGSKGGG